MLPWHLGEMRALGRRLAGARDARLRVDDDRRARPGPPRAAAAARAPRRSDSSRRTRSSCAVRQLVAIPLGQPVGERTSRRRRVRIPALAARSPGRAAGRRRTDRRPACRRPRARGATFGRRVSGNARERRRPCSAVRRVDVERLHRRVPDTVRKAGIRRGSEPAEPMARRSQRRDAGRAGAAARPRHSRLRLRRLP